MEWTITLLAYDIKLLISREKSWDTSINMIEGISWMVIVFILGNKHIS